MIVGTAGHIDHGKTSLVKALTGVDTDRLKEEKARGITIELGFAYAAFSEEAVTGFVDVPGHERFIHTMLAGASGIDYALLVVAADDGIKPQTVEHVAILDLLGIDRGVVALTKTDLVDEVRREAVAAEIRSMLASTPLRTAEILPVSVLTGDGLEKLKQTLAEAEIATPSHNGGGFFRLAVDRSFTLKGAGTIVTGTVLSGSIALDDDVTISPSGLSARVRSIHAQNHRTENGHAGQRCALNLVGDGISKEIVGRGDMIVDPALHSPADRIDAELHLLDSEPRPVGDWFSARLHHGSAEIGVRLVPLEGRVVPGSRALVQLVLERPIAAAVGDRFVLRDVSAQRTIGGGKFLDLRAPLRKRRTEDRLALLKANADLDTTTALSAALNLSPHVVNLDVFARDRALTELQLRQAMAAIDVVALLASSGRYGLSGHHRSRLSREIQAKLYEFHAEKPDLQGIGRERLRLQVYPRLPADAFGTALRQDVEGGLVALDGAFVRLPSHEVRLTEDEETLYHEFIPYLVGDERFRPPRVRDLASLLGRDEKEVRRIMKLCARLGRVDQIRHDHFFTRTTTAEMVDIIVDVAASSGGEFAAGLFRDRVNNGRKVAIEILEFYDRQGVTIRRGDMRRVNPHRLDLFRPSDSDSGEGRDSSPVGRPDFKSGWGSEAVLGGFDSHSLPPAGAIR